MEFGMVPHQSLNDIDFLLRPEPAFNAAVLPGRQLKQPKIYTGCNMWGKKEWAGKIYPATAKEKDFLEYYAKQYNAVELNATQYKMYPPQTLAKWKDKVGPKDFKFCAKMFNGITHQGNLNDKAVLTTAFLQSLQVFEDRLGPVLIQLSDAFSPKRKLELFDFLSGLPGEMQFFLELRHPAWFTNDAAMEELFIFLKQNNIGAVITDTAGRRDCAHLHLTLPKTFIRFVGNSLHETDFTRCMAWIQRIQYWVTNGLEELYFFMSMPDETVTPELTVYFIQALNTALGLQLKVPAIITQKSSQIKLF